ncbi:MAG: DUF349 domain-containing protein [Vicinamibacterales bacterium]
MAFLDRFKPQPKWRHADAAVRTAAVAEIPGDDEHRAVLVELAAQDPDPRVRRAAIERLDRAEDLVGLVRTEGHEDLRRLTAERLVRIATTPADNDGEAALALAGLDDQRHLSTVAKESPFDTVRTAALGRVRDVRALGSIARHASDSQTAFEAVLRIADRAELVNVALKTDHKDAGLAALEQIAGSEDPAGNLRETLDTVAVRAKNKGVSKQARAMVVAIDQAESARRAALEAWQQRVVGVVARMEACANAPAGPGSAQRLAEAEEAWRELAADPAFPIDAGATARYGTLAASAHAGIKRYEEEEAARRAEEDRRLSILAAATTLCNRVDDIRGDTALDEIDRARAEWEGLQANPVDPKLNGLRTRFEAACERAAERYRNRQELQRIYAHLEEISQQADRLAGEESFNEEAWRAAVQAWETQQPRADGLDSAIADRFHSAVERVNRRLEERRAAAERAARQQLQRVEQLMDRTHKRAAAEDLTLREADRLARELRSAIDAPPAVITDDRERHALIERLRHAQSALLPRLHDLREMDEWKRFANAAVQEELIAKTEALRVKYGFDNGAARAEPSAAEEGAPPAAPQPELKPEELEKLARELHEIQERWKTVAEAPRAQAQALWHRYRQAADPLQIRVREFFVVRNEERRTNLQKKLALIERAEAIADSTDWIKTADELKKMQVEWQQIGPVPRQDSKAVWKRFRDACDRFFTRRNADLAQRKEVWSANLGRKEALCKRAEEIAASVGEWDKHATEIRRLQAEWKTIGPVRRNKSEAIWQRFRAASDLFFERYKRRDEIELQSKQADREGLVVELESLAPTPATADATTTSARHDGAEGLLERVRSLRSRWNLTTPVVRQGADPLSARFMAALERVMSVHPEAFAGTELDVEANRQKMERLCTRVEALTIETAVAQAPTGSQALAAMLREALAANTIGGRAGEESKWKAMAEDVRQAQAAWNRLGPVPGDAGRALTERFHRACNRFHEQYRRKVPPQQQSARGRPVGTR